MTIQNYYYSGQGSLWIAERSVLGVPTGFVRVGNVPELTLDIATTVFEHKESESGSRGIDLSLTKENKATFAIKMENMSLDNLALGLYGTKTIVASGAVGAESVKIYEGKKSPLAHPDVSAVVVTGLTVTTDYVIDAKNGTIEGVAGGALVNGTAYSVAYNYAAASKVDAFTETAPERWLRFNGLNTVDGTSVVVDIFRAKFDPLTGYGLINEDIASASMKGTILADSLRVSGSKFFQQWNLA